MTRLVVYRARPPQGDDRYGIRNEGSGTDRLFPSVEMMLEALSEAVALHRTSRNSLELSFGPEDGIIAVGGQEPLRYRQLAPQQQEAVWLLFATPYRFAEVS